MEKNKNLIKFVAVVIFVGIIIVMTMKSIKDNSVFLRKHEAYKEFVNGITIDSLTNNEYILSMTIESNFELKNSYEEYDYQDDEINIIVNLTGDFDTMDIKNKCIVLESIDEELENILSEGKISTGYIDLCKEFIPFKGSNVKTSCDVDIEYFTTNQMYKFNVDAPSTLYVEDLDPYDYVVYKISRNGEDITDVKERENKTSASSSTSSSSSYTGAYDAKLKYSGTEGVLICISEDAMERFMTAVINGNEGTLQELFLEGQCAYTEQGTKCNIVDRKLTKCKVKLLDGSYAGNTVWVVIESVQEE